MHMSGRASWFFLLGLVLIAAVLLVAGFSAGVGIGILVGLLHGGALAISFVAIRPPTSAGARYWASEHASAMQPDQALLERHHRESMRVAGVDAGALQRVIPVARTLDAHGARLELVAIELREDGGIATLVAHTRPPIGMLGHFVEVSVLDGAGTTYAASEQGSGGSNVGTARYEVRFAPAPPAGAGHLTIRIDSFASPVGMGTTQLTGPWEFRVAL